MASWTLVEFVPMVKKKRKIGRILKFKKMKLVTVV